MLAQVDYLKWLRYYLDVCAKYGHRPRESDSLPLFLEKLSAKGQSAAFQRQAADSVKHYYHLVEAWPQGETSPSFQPGEREWEFVFQALNAAIRVRQYSPKTLKTYRGWIVQFQRFLENKRPRGARGRAGGASDNG